MVERGEVETAIRQALRDLEVDEITKHNGNRLRHITVRLPDDEESRARLGRIISEARSTNPLLNSVSIGYPRDEENLYTRGVWVIYFSEK
jgi:hypothetical protein